jgi:predicted transcriptional regulator
MSPDTARVQQNEDVAVTKLRNIRVDEALWREAMRIATERRETLSAVIKRALVEYVERHGGDVSR